MRLVHSILLIAAAMALAVNTATAQDTGTQKQNRCKLIKAKRGAGAELVPEGELDDDQERVFFYVFNQERLLDGFRVKEERRRGCLAAFGLLNSVAGGASAGGAAAGGAAAGGVAAAGAGIGTITIGATAVAVGLGAIIAGAAVGVASGAGKAGTSTSTTCTTC